MPNPMLEDFLAKLSFALQTRDKWSKVAFHEDRICFDIRSHNPNLVRSICAQKGFVLDKLQSEPQFWKDGYYNKDYDGTAYKVTIPCVLPLVTAPRATPQQVKFLEFLFLWTDLVVPCGITSQQENNHSSFGTPRRLQTAASRFEIAFLEEQGFNFEDGALKSVTHENWEACLGLSLQQSREQKQGWIHPAEVEDNPHEGDADALILPNVPISLTLGVLSENNTVGRKAYRHPCTWTDFAHRCPKSIIVANFRVRKLNDISFTVQDISDLEYTIGLLDEAVYHCTPRYGSHPHGHQKYGQLDPIAWIRDVFQLHHAPLALASK